MSMLAPRPSVRRAARPFSVLLVEDSPADALLVREELRDAGAPGFDVDHVDHLADALERLATRSFDVAVVDLSLPDSHGLTTFDTVAAHADGIPVVVLSGLADEHIALHAVQRGAQDYRVKGEGPPGELADALRAALDRSWAERELAQLAAFDAVTGLPRRAMLERRLTTALARATRRGDSVPVLHVELEPAHAELVRAASERLGAARPAADALGHVGDAAFAIVADSVDEPADAADLAGHLLDLLARPFVIGGRSVDASARVGIALGPADGRHAAGLLAAARTAACGTRPSSWAFSDSELCALTKRRHALRWDLHEALRSDQLLLLYQPLVARGSRDVIGAEALMRWRHPQLGLVGPTEFIPLAEETGLIGALGEWALRTACAQLREWDAQGLPELRVAVNVSPRQIAAAPTLLRAVDNALTTSGVPPERLELELTEHSFADPAPTARALRELRQRGVRVAIDDFGTGFASLSYLHRFPIDTLKIDRSFVAPLEVEPQAAPIVTGIISMAHQLDLFVVAEGVETKSQTAFLEAQGCDGLQGFGLCRPRPGTDIARWLAERVS